MMGRGLRAGRKKTGQWSQGQKIKVRAWVDYHHRNLPPGAEGGRESGRRMLAGLGSQPQILPCFFLTFCGGSVLDFDWQPSHCSVCLHLHLVIMSPCLSYNKGPSCLQTGSQSEVLESGTSISFYGGSKWNCNGWVNKSKVLARLNGRLLEVGKTSCWDLGQYHVLHQGEQCEWDIYSAWHWWLFVEMTEK